MDSKDKKLERVVLECSFKVFSGFDQVNIIDTLTRLFNQWMSLVAGAESVAVLLWIADGSEILEWRGMQNDPVEWARWVGFNNTESSPYGHNVTPEMTAVPYRPFTPELTYLDIKRVVSLIKIIGPRITGVPITVGATFDAGPEFSKSDFKYRRHTEILAKGEQTGIGRIIQMVRPWSQLKAEERSYAGFPDGIAEGTGFGTFLGRQSELYLEAMGFDYLWLSNGFGFSSFSWTALGETFDGKKFHGYRSSKLGADIRNFWEDFRNELNFPVEVRGTNLTAGMDIGSDSVPALWIYESGIICKPPPNSPWGPLNRDFGIELTGYMSRIAVLPGSGFPFRFYANDPWFWQNPWWDFYNREPFDIYLPLSVSRINALGETEVASDVEILGVDTQYGELDSRTGAEISSYINRARESAPDKAGLLVWLYPFRQYHEQMEICPDQIGDAYFEDCLVTGAVNAGLPINTVISTDDALNAIDSGVMDESIVLTPASTLNAENTIIVKSLLARGIDVIIYGAVPATPEPENLLNLHRDEPGLNGELVIRGERIGSVSRKLKHVGALSSGGISETVIAGNDVNTRILLTASNGAETRPYMLERNQEAGRLIWLRGSSTFDSVPYNEHALRIPATFRGTEFIDPSNELVTAVRHLGFNFGFGVSNAGSQVSVQTVHRSDNALWFNGYLADTTIDVRYAFPNGIPLLTHSECTIEDGVGRYHFGTTVHKECRFMVKQSAGTLTCRELAPFPYGVSRLFQIEGLVESVVTVLLPAKVSQITLVVNEEPLEVPQVNKNDTIIIPLVSGGLKVGWSLG